MRKLSGFVFWMLLGLNTFHVLGGVLENAALLMVLFRGPVEQKLTVDVQSSPAGTTFTVGLRMQGGGVDDFEVGSVESTERV